MTQRFASQDVGNKDKWLRLDLQFYNDEPEVFRGGYNPDEEIEVPEGNPLSADEPTNEPNNEPNNEPEGNPNGEPTPEGEPQGEPTDEQVFDFAGRQVKVNDPESIKGAREDYINAQSYIQQQAQQLSQMQQQMMQLQQQAQPQQQYEQQYEQPEPEQPQMDPEEFMEKFYEDPMGTMQEFQQQAIQQATQQVQQQYEPFIREQQINKEINTVKSKYPDFDDYRDQMSQVISEIGEEGVDQIGLERVYHMAKGLNAQQQPQQPDPNQLIQDPNFVNQLMQNQEFMQQLTQNPDISNQVIQNYAQQKTQDTPPSLMNGNKGAAPTFSKENAPKSISEAGKMYRKNLGI